MKYFTRIFYLATYWILAYNIFNCQIHIRMFIWSRIFENFEIFKKMTIDRLL